MVSNKPWRGKSEIEKLEALAVDLKLLSWSCRSMHGWMGAAVKQSSDRCEKFPGDLDLCTRCFGVRWLDTVH